MSKNLFIFLFLSSCFAMKMPEISMQEALKSFSDMQDENSKILKDSNYKQILANTSLP